MTLFRYCYNHKVYQSTNWMTLVTFSIKFGFHNDGGHYLPLGESEVEIHLERV